ncbi:MAG: hypothetical protein F6J93_08065 [Oscillatoria sp. SIO1A7]|nr:hypothetical protein [Oscillatoria sp. SIO1A7]
MVFILATLLLVPSTGSLAGVTAIVAYSVDLGFEVHRNSQDKREIRGLRTEMGLLRIEMRLSQEQSDREIQKLRAENQLLQEEVQRLRPPEDEA